MIRPKKGKNVLFGEAKLKTAQFSCKQTKPFIFGARKLKKFWPRNKKEKRCFCLHKAQNTAICSTLEVNPYSLQKKLKEASFSNKKNVFRGMKNSPMKLQTKKTGFWWNNKAAKKLKIASFSNKKNKVFGGMKNSPMKLQTKETGFWWNNKAAKKLKEASFSNKKKTFFEGWGSKQPN